LKEKNFEINFLQNKTRLIFLFPILFFSLIKGKPFINKKFLLKDLFLSKLNKKSFFKEVFQFDINSKKKVLRKKKSKQIDL